MIQTLLFFLGRLSGATGSCLFWMVQGDPWKITKLHWEIALETGFFSAVVLLLLYRFAVYWNIAITDFNKALATTIVVSAIDITLHASHYPGYATEAILTGITAAALTFGFRLFGLKVLAFLKLHAKKQFAKS